MSLHRVGVTLAPVPVGNLRSEILVAGILYQGPITAPDPNQAVEGFELVSARHAHFILADGRLDRARWQSLNL